ARDAAIDVRKLNLFDPAWRIFFGPALAGHIEHVAARVRASSTRLTLQLGRSATPGIRSAGPLAHDHGIIRDLMSSIARQVVLVALLLAAVLGLFIAAESGQRRLEDASRQVQQAAQRQGALANVWQLVRQAESSQRGYILTDDSNYLMPFQEASGNLPQALG